MLSCLIICYGPLLITCNCNYFLLQLYGERYVKVVTSISPEAVEFMKLLFLYLKQNDKRAQFKAKMKERKYPAIHTDYS